MHGRLDPLTVTRGKTHEYLGMTLNFEDIKGACIITQCDFIKKLHNSLPQELKGPYRKTPAPPDLFKVNKNAELVSKDKADKYHEVSAKSLWVSQRGRPDLQLATGFHCARIRDTNIEDFAKLRWMMGYLWFTRYLPLIVAIDEDGNVCMHVDGAHAVHVDGKGHSGLFVTMGRGAMINASKKLGVNTISSTETEIVSDGERFPKCAWFRYFRLAQGDDPKGDLLFQDNTSCITLHKNHPFRTGKGSKHTNIRCFFVADKIEQKEVKMIYCPTEKMIADYSTKPTQGSLFVCQRNTTLGIDESEFVMCKEWCKAALVKHELWDEDESDLEGLQRRMGWYRLLSS